MRQGYSSAEQEFGAFAVDFHNLDQHGSLDEHHTQVYHHILAEVGIGLVARSVGHPSSWLPLQQRQRYLKVTYLLLEVCSAMSAVDT